MAALTASLIALSLAQTGMSVYGQRKAANAAQAQGDFEGGQLDQQAADALTRGQAAESNMRSRTASTIGTQRAAYAGQGVDVASGTAKDIQAETQTIGDFDALTIRNNAMRESHGLSQQAGFVRAGGKNTADALRTQSWGTLLTGGAQAISQARDAGWFNRGGSSLSVPRGVRAPSSTGYPS